MTLSFTVDLVVLAAACAVASMRWLRVAQREHYLAGATIRFFTRWWRLHVRDLLALAIAIAGVCVSVRYPFTALVTAVVIVRLPEGLSLRGRTAKLIWTRRLKTVAATLVFLAAVTALIGASTFGLRGAAVAIGIDLLAIPLLVDAALFVLAPVEKWLGQKYVGAAKERLRRVRPTVVAITGSYGKTSTKGYVAHLLGGRFEVLASPQSYNNQAGLTKTVNELLTPGTDVLVAEMGAYGKGEIAALCSWLPPTIAVITAIGPVHLERFKTLDRTLAAKSEITVGADVVVLNVDDERLAAFADQLRATGRQVVRCSATAGDINADVQLVETNLGIEVLINHERAGNFELDQLGGVALSNVACAIGVGLVFKCSPLEIVERLSSLPITDHRLQARPATSGALILDDTFNSNPAGTRLALDRLVAISSEGHRRVVVTPGMVELGSMQFSENAAFAQRAAEVATDFVIVGHTNRRALKSGAMSAAHASSVEVREMDNRDAAVAYVAKYFGPGDVILYENDLPDHFP